MILEGVGSKAREWLSVYKRLNGGKYGLLFLSLIDTYLHGLAQQSLKFFWLQVPTEADLMQEKQIKDKLKQEKVVKATDAPAEQQEDDDDEIVSCRMEAVDASKEAFVSMYGLLLSSGANRGRKNEFIVGENLVIEFFKDVIAHDRELGGRLLPGLKRIFDYYKNEKPDEYSRSKLATLL